VANAKQAKNAPKPLPSIETDEGVTEVLQRAGEGDKAVLPLVKELFDRDRPECRKVLERYGNIFHRACWTITDFAAGTNVAVREASIRKIKALRDELAGPNPTPLERILCERVALCWFDANHADLRYIDPNGQKLAFAQYEETRRDRAHKRFLAACKTLAMVRKLDVPAIQVNLAHQQVNVSGST
jgi:hypothetical protein